MRLVLRLFLAASLAVEVPWFGLFCEKTLGQEVSYHTITSLRVPIRQEPICLLMTWTNNCSSTTVSGCLYIAYDILCSVQKQGLPADEWEVEQRSNTRKAKEFASQLLPHPRTNSSESKATQRRLQQWQGYTRRKKGQSQALSSWPGCLPQPW